MENIHNHTYSLLIDTYIKDENEKDFIFKSMHNIESLKQIANWSMKWMESDAPFNQRLYAFSILEGVMFQGAFTCIFWLSKRNLMHGFTFSNELISRDEGLHYMFANLLYNNYL